MLKPISLKRLVSLLTILVLTCGFGSRGVFAGQPVVCIDPGHPSEVGRGTSGKQWSEIHAVWVTSLALKAELARRGFAVVMTKQAENQFVANRERARIANRSHAALLVRLHCDADAGSGFAVYYPDRQGTSHGIRGPSATVLASSKRAAIAFHAAFTATLHGELPDRGLLPDTRTHVGAKQGALTGSIFATEPVLLVEMCVLTNASDEAYIMSARGRSTMARALADGVVAALR